MPYRRMIVASVGVVALLAIVSLSALHRLPVGTMLPVHWNADGRPDRFMTAARALLLTPMLAALLSLLMAAIPYAEPLQNRLDRSATLYRTTWAATLGMLLLIEAMIAGPAFGVAISGTLPLVGVGIMLIVLGNAMPKSRPGFFVGIRTPWTLTDPDNWIATHRVGGWTMIAGGVVMLVSALLPIGGSARTVALFVAVGLTLVPVAYSWWFWRTHRTA